MGQGTETYFKWEESFSIGNDMIDNEHKKLLELANKVQSVHTGEEATGKINAAFRELYDYTHYHFKHEEEYMQSIDYAGLDGQKGQHRHIIKQMDEILNSELEPRSFLKRLHVLMRQWVIAHILKMDKRIQGRGKT